MPDSSAPEEDITPPQPNAEDSISEEELALLMDDSGELFADDFIPLISTTNRSESQADPSGGSGGEERTLSQAEIDALLASLRQDGD